MGIAPDIMEEYLDDCLEGEELATADKFKITFKYHFLGPPRMKTEGNEPLLKDQGGGTEVRKELPETEPLWYMAQIPEHRHLMSHPNLVPSSTDISPSSHPVHLHHHVPRGQLQLLQVPGLVHHAHHRLRPLLLHHIPTPRREGRCWGRDERPLCDSGTLPHEDDHH